MSIEEIEKRIPHREPMRLIDEIVSESQSTIVCRKTFREDEFFVQGHFPDYPVVPGVILCECCMQAGAALLFEHTASDAEASPTLTTPVPVATRMDSVKFKRIVRPGDTIEIEVTLNEKLSTAFFMTAKVRHEGKLAARLDFACSVTDPGAASKSQS